MTDPFVLKLFHGRNTATEVLHDWGFDGPVLGPLEAVQLTYGSIALYAEDRVELSRVDDLIFYDGKFYGNALVCLASEHTPTEQIDPLKTVCDAAQPPCIAIEHELSSAFHACVAVFVDAVTQRVGQRAAAACEVALRRFTPHHRSANQPFEPVPLGGAGRDLARVDEPNLSDGLIRGGRLHRLNKREQLPPVEQSNGLTLGKASRLPGKIAGSDDDDFIGVLRPQQAKHFADDWRADGICLPLLALNQSRAAIAAQNPVLPHGLNFEIRPLESERGSAYRLTNETPAA